MRRDMDFIRELLLKIEGIDKPPSLQELLSDNANEAEYEKLAEHLSMLIDEAAFESGIPVHSMVAKSWMVLRVTWQGHDFLDSVRDPEIWAKTKTGAAAAKGFTADLLKDLAKGLVKKPIEEFTGIKL